MTLDEKVLQTDGLTDGRTDGLTDNARVAFATENSSFPIETIYIQVTKK